MSEQQAINERMRQRTLKEVLRVGAAALILFTGAQIRHDLINMNEPEFTKNPITWIATPVERALFETGIFPDPANPSIDVSRPPDTTSANDHDTESKKLPTWEEIWPAENT